MKRKCAFLWFGGLLISVGCTNSDERFRAGLLNKPAPDFELKDMNGDTVKLSQFRGKPVVVAFFAFG